MLHPSPRVAAFDGYRAIAILIVMLHHASLAPGFYEPVRALFDFLPIGVRAFWVLSGFLITRSILRDEERDGRIRLPPFYLRQAIRYFIPLAGYVLPLMLYIAVRYPQTDWPALLRPLAIDPGTYCIGKGVAHLYSLVMQIYFWLAWPVVLSVLPRRFRLPVGFFLATAAVFWGAYGQDLAVARGTCDGRVDYFFAAPIFGACVALAEPQLRVLIERRFGLAAIFVVIVALMLWLVFGVRGAHQEATFSIALGLIVFLLANTSLPRAASILSWPPLAWLGRISFSLYLWQNLFCYGLTGTVLDRFPLNLCASIILGWIAYRLVELPSLRWRSALRPNSALSPTAVPVLAQT